MFQLFNIAIYDNLWGYIGGVALGIEHLPIKHGALSSNPSTAKKKKIGFFFFVLLTETKVQKSKV
jgi:hypothetical protein